MTLKKIFLSLVLLSTIFNVSGQKVTLIKTGRPLTFEYNNAERIVGNNWGITFVYFAFDGRDFDVLDSINAQNNLNGDKMAAVKGPDWEVSFRKEVEAELGKEKELRKKIEDQTVSLMPGAQKMVAFERSKWSKNKYTAYVFAQLEKEGKRPFYILQEYKVNAKKGSVKLKSGKEKPVHFEYPENGITK